MCSDTNFLSTLRMWRIKRNRRTSSSQRKMPWSVRIGAQSISSSGRRCRILGQSLAPHNRKATPHGPVKLPDVLANQTLNGVGVSRAGRLLLSHQSPGPWEGGLYGQDPIGGSAINAKLKTSLLILFAP